MGVEDFEAWPKLVKRAPLPATRRVSPIPGGREIFRKKDRLKRALALSGQWSDLGDPEISVLAAHPEMEDVLSDAAWASPEWGMGDDETLEGFKLKKVFKKIVKVAKKALPLVAGAVLAVAIPGVGAAIGKGLSVAMGALKWGAGKLLSAPKSVVDALTAQGKDPATATPDEVISIAQAVGAITPTTKPAIETPAAPPPAPPPRYYPPPAPPPREYYPPAEAAPPREFEPGAPAAPALPGYLPYLLGGGALALVLLPRLMERRA